MLDIRSKLEAEGERRMMGSERLLLTAEERGLAELATGREVNCVFEGREGCGCDLLGRRPRKSSLCLRM